MVGGKRGTEPATFSSHIRVLLQIQKRLKDGAKWQLIDRSYSIWMVKHQRGSVFVFFLLILSSSIPVRVCRELTACLQAGLLALLGDRPDSEGAGSESYVVRTKSA